MGGEPDRGCIGFSDLVADDKGTPGHTLTRIAIEPELGAADAGQLQVLELAYPIGAPVTFTGKVRLYGGEDPALVGEALKLALDAVPALGAHKSAGFGEIVKTSLDEDETQADPVEAPNKSASRRYEAFLEIEGPFLVGAERVAPNVFKGAVTISGATVKGAVADALGLTPTSTGSQADFLASAVFREARPQIPLAWNDQRTPRPPPLSLAVYGNDKARDGQGEYRRVGDALLAKEPFIETIGGAPVAPAFAVDWKGKDKGAVECYCLNPATPAFLSLAAAEGLLRREARTHTAIDAETGSAARNAAGAGLLFVYEMVHPCLREGGKKVSWRFEIVADGAGASPHLAKLAGLELRLGKLGTHARIVAIEPIDEIEPAGTFDLNGREAAAIQLLTPALLSPLDALRKKQGDIEAVYQESFAAVFAGIDVGLERFFARQRLIGGWQAMRYPSRPGGAYDPWVATEPGSVFLLSVAKADAERFIERLRELLRDGLPEQGLVTRKLPWQACPFARINGFGEIALWTPGDPQTSLRVNLSGEGV